MCKPDGEQQDCYDDRPLVKDLLEKHGKAIASVRHKILADDEGKALYEQGDNSERYDDIWILRYVLSHKGNVRSATKAALATMKFREEIKLNELGDIRHRLKHLGIPNGPVLDEIEPLPGYTWMNQYCSTDAASVVQHDRNRGPVVYCNVGGIDQDGIVENMDDEEIKNNQLYSNEALYQILDDTTRRTGRLTKITKIIDMGNTSLRQMNRAYLKHDAAMSKLLEEYHPQLLGCMLIYNSPTWVSGLWAVMKPFFPKRVAEKVDFLPSPSKMKGNKKALKPLLKYISEENLPERYGGLNKEWPLPCASELYVPK